MPALELPSEEANAFTVINHEELEARAEGPPARSVNVVRPLQRDAGPPLPSARTERPEAAPAVAVAPQTILDPKFTRALDFKLRRLKEKEILEANLRRPTRHRRRPGALAASDPDVARQEHAPPEKSTSRSQSHIDAMSVDADRTRMFLEKSSIKSRSRMLGAGDGDKPRFVTTVKTGQFLLPPPDVACLLGLETLYPPQDRDKIVYSYSSKPKAVATRSKRSPPEKKSEKVPNGAPPGMQSSGPSRAAEAFRGVRALVAGVAGVRHLLERHDRVGSMATGTTGATGATGATAYSNLMHDKRVVRGSTFAPLAQAAGDGAESCAARVRRRALARRAARARLRPATPPPAPGRRHLPVQTDRYLQELFDKGVEMEVGVQTELFAERPATPAYAPASTGADACTQIHPGDLFDFDLEVQPILEVLVGKTTEQALGEVAQEEELATLREQQRRYRELRDAERAERQRCAAQDDRLQREKARRAAEAVSARAAGSEARARAAAAALVQGYVAELLPAVLAGLRGAGYLRQRLQRGVDEEFMPWLIDEVSQEIESIITSRDVLTEIVRDVMEARAELLGAAAARASPGPAPDALTPPSAEQPAENEADE